MHPSLKEAIKQLVPPVLVSLGRAPFASRQPSESAEVRALRVDHERLNQNLGDDEIGLRPGLSVKVHPQSREAFEAFCYRYPEMVEELSCFIKLSAGKRRLLDVGALHGIFSIVFSASDPAKKAVAVDASPIAFARLLYNVHKNKLANVTPVECALSEDAGVVRMHYEWEHLVAAGTSKGDAPAVSVEKRTGDSLCASLGFEPDVMKIDVEGHEMKVLRGLWTTIKRAKPLLFLEVHPQRVREEGDRLEDLESMFGELGYRVESIAGESLAMRTVLAATADQRIVLLPS